MATYKSKSAFGLLMLTLMALLASVLAGCMPGRGQLGGVITDLQGVPVAGAVVRLGAQATQTDLEGRYAFTEVPPGVYPFVVQAAGFLDHARTLTVRAGVQRLDLELRRRPPVAEAEAEADRSPPGPRETEEENPQDVPVPALKLPLPGGYHWLLSVEPGGAFYGGEPDEGHTGRSYFSLDFIDNNREQGELTGVREVPVLAAADGIVVETRNSIICRGCRFGYGNYVVLDHGGGFTTIYGHLKYPSVAVRLGERVKQGQVLGIMGSTGHSTGIHVHFEVRYRNEGITQAAVLERVRLEGLPLGAYRVGSVQRPTYYLSTQRALDEEP